MIKIQGSFLLKQAQEKAPALLDSLFVPSALAILLHHYRDVWRRRPGGDDDAWQELPKRRKLPFLKFEQNPLAFLLMFCDCAQEWMRPRHRPRDQENPDGEDEDRYVLSECRVTASECSITVKAPFLSRDQRFQDKRRELEHLRRFLISPSGVRFGIILLDRSGAGRPYWLKRGSSG